MKYFFRRWALILTLTVALAIPAVVLADNCGSYSDCYDTGRAATEAAAALAMAAIVFSTALDLSPVGPLKAAAQAFTGEDLVTGEKVNRLEQVLGAVPVGKIIGLAAKGATHFARDTARVARAAEKFAAGSARAGQAAAKLSKQSDNWRAAGRLGRTAGQAWDVKEKLGNIKTVGEAGQKIKGVLNDTSEKLASLGNKSHIPFINTTDNDSNTNRDQGTKGSPPSRNRRSGGGAGTASR